MSVTCTQNIEPREAQIRASVLELEFSKLKIKAMEPIFKHVSQKFFFNTSQAVWADSGGPGWRDSMPVTVPGEPQGSGGNCLKTAPPVVLLQGPVFKASSSSKSLKSEFTPTVPGNPLRRGRKAGLPARLQWPRYQGVLRPRGIPSEV